ncbi:MAG: NAD(P)/FAD-dependent oxidoreductase [Acidimicrobiia bacterium]
MTAVQTIAVIGASLAGLRAVETLRAEGFAGRIEWIGAEAHLPYDRPPLSKSFLTSFEEPEPIALRSTSYDALDCTPHLGVRATALDVERQTVTLETGMTIHYDGAVLAPGATARRLPGQPDLPGVHMLRTLDDARALRAALVDDPRVVIIGAGFIGAEVASSCRARGISSVTMLEAGAIPMERVFGPELGAVLAQLHRSHGVDLRCNASVAGIEGTVHATGVRLTDSTIVPADVVLVAVGAAPATDWLIGSGLTIDNGIVCDSTLLAAPNIVAAGDACAWMHPLFEERIRIEHWTNAVEQGVAASRRLMFSGARAPEFASIPFVWSDQHGSKFQVVGRVRGDANVHVAVGSFDEPIFVAVFETEGRVMGVVGCNQPRRMVRARHIVGSSDLTATIATLRA